MELIEEAAAAGARRAAACDVLGLSLRRLQRWERNPEQEDGRMGPKTSAHALSEDEKKEIVAVANRVEYRDLSPWQIVAKLADSGRYLASESSFYRVLKANDLLSHRSRAKPRAHSRPRELVSRKPNEVWSWDITFLKSPVSGMYYYLYLIEDIFSRKIVGWSVEEAEDTRLAARLTERACFDQGVEPGQVTLHSDNGSPMKGATMLSTLQRLGVVPSFSRPKVSDDNPYSEALFKTLKYRPSFPSGAFAGLEEARQWVERFVSWYNTEHLHSGIKFVTPESRHSGLDHDILQNRRVVYEAAKQANPLRWSRQTRNWNRVMKVILNPGKEARIRNEMLRDQAA
jgi:putative transposase